MIISLSESEQLLLFLIYLKTYHLNHMTEDGLMG